MVDHKDIGRRIRQLRSEQFLTQEQLAEKAEISTSFLSHIERGTKQASLTSIIRLAATLEVPLDWLVFGCDLRENGKTLQPEMQSLIAGCSPLEQKIVLDTAIALRKILSDSMMRENAAEDRKGQRKNM